LAGNDLSTMTPETVSLLTNHDVIAVDQDAAGKQGDRVSAEGPVEVWARSLADGSKAVGIFNRQHAALVARVDFASMGFKGAVKAWDLWQEKELGRINGLFVIKVPAHGVVFLKVTQ